jgi:hypothetical protein
LGVLYADQGKLDKAEKMYQRALQGYEKALGADNVTTYILASKALVGYDKVVGPDHPRSRSLQDNLRALDTVTENKALIDVREPVNKFQREASHLGAKGTLSESKRHKLLKKLGLR